MNFCKIEEFQYCSNHLLDLNIILRKEGKSDSSQLQNQAVTKKISNNKENYYNDDTENISTNVTFITKVLAVDSSQEVAEKLEANLEQSTDILENVELNDDVQLDLEKVVENLEETPIQISEKPNAEIEINYEPESDPPTTTTTTSTTAMTTTTTTTTTTTISEEQNTESTSSENSTKGLAL